MSYPTSYKFKCEKLGDAFFVLSKKYGHPDEIGADELEALGVPKETADLAMMLLVEHVVTDDGFTAWMKWMHVMADRGL